MAKKVKEVKKIEFDPRKTYKWEPEAEFPLTGIEYSIILNHYVQNKKSQLLAELDILNILEAKLKESVETGIAVELVENVEGA